MRIRCDEEQALWRAPAESGQALIAPSWSTLRTALAPVNRVSCVAAVDCGGRSGRELIEEARSALLNEAAGYSRAYRYVDLPADTRTMVLTGHQPELFHPGVWFKNFVAAHLAEEQNGVAVHLVIDNDLPRGLSVRCPTRADGKIVIQRCPIDLGGPLWPYEDRPVRDQELFRSAGERLGQTISQLVPGALIADYWPLVLQAADRRAALGYTLAEARHRFEERFGLHTLEIPLSRVCQLEPVRWWWAWLFGQAMDLQRVYNGVLDEYWQERASGRARLPVAALRTDGAWCELPFWAWSRDYPVRKPLWCRVHQHCVELSTRNRIHLCLPRRRDVARAAEELARAETAGVRIRPRALLTTLTARCLLGDLFIHGIGGAHYDQLTDRLAVRFFGQAPPPFGVVTATLWLPVEHSHISHEELTEARRMLRELTYHPERFLRNSDDPQIEKLVQEKSRWKKRVEGADRPVQFEVITRVNSLLQPYVAPLRLQWLEKLERLERQRAICRVLDAREYPFVLFPESFLKEAFRSFVAAARQVDMPLVQM